MPSTLTYPGVYVEEVPSGVRTIVGVSTSIAAFVGRTARGPVNDATTVTGMADFERAFGGIDPTAPLPFAVAYAVRDFFLNGGSQAVIVRLMDDAAIEPPQLAPPTTPPTGHATAAASGAVTVYASSPGDWANKLEVVFTLDDPAERPDLFNLEVRRPNPGDRPTVLEGFRALSTNPTDPRAADRVLAAGSLYLRAILGTGGALPAAGTVPLAGVATGAPNIPLSSKTRYTADAGDRKGVRALAGVDLFNLLCIPPDTVIGDTDKDVYADALAYCEERRAMLIVDPPADWQSADSGRMKPALKNNPRQAKDDDLKLSGTGTRNAALFYPRVMQPDPAQDGREAMFAPCGLVAGVFARTDATRGVWKAPAGLDATALGVRRLAVNLTDDENGLLNPVGVNCLRFFPAGGNVVWGARTLRGDDQLADEYKYVPVRRLALFIEESLYRGTQWAVFEPNDEPLWAQLRLNVGAFLRDLFRQGAFQGKTPREAYLVKCDKETTTQSDVNRGVVNVVVGFAPLKPAEFVVLRVQQLAGQIDS